MKGTRAATFLVTKKKKKLPERFKKKGDIISD
jgi:hypothetical protein